MEWVSTRGSGNYASDIEKENARLRRELRDAKDALDVFKKAISISGKMTEAIYLPKSIANVKLQEGTPRFVSGMPRHLGASEIRL